MDEQYRQGLITGLAMQPLQTEISVKKEYIKEYIGKNFYGTLTPLENEEWSNYINSIKISIQQDSDPNIIVAEMNSKLAEALGWEIKDDGYIWEPEGQFGIQFFLNNGALNNYSNNSLLKRITNGKCNIIDTDNSFPFELYHPSYISIYFIKNTNCIAIGSQPYSGQVPIFSMGIFYNENNEKNGFVYGGSYKSDNNYKRLNYNSEIINSMTLPAESSENFHALITMPSVDSSAMSKNLFIPKLYPPTTSSYAIYSDGEKKYYVNKAIAIALD